MRGVGLCFDGQAPFARQKHLQIVHTPSRATRAKLLIGSTSDPVLATAQEMPAERHRIRGALTSGFGPRLR